MKNEVQLEVKLKDQQSITSLLENQRKHPNRERVGENQQTEYPEIRINGPIIRFWSAAVFRKSNKSAN